MGKKGCNEMPTIAQQEKIQANLNTLDYLKGTGIIETRKRRLANERFLFISSGGNGHNTLQTLREQLEWKVEAAELQKKVRFLAIDTAHQEMDRLVENGFDATEILKLPYEGAHESIAPGKMLQQMLEWVYPKLYDETGGMAVTAPAQSGFDPTGAGAWRQPGRVRLCQPQSLTALNSAVHTAVSGLMVDKPAGARLNVFFLSGLAGGTGSGTIIDLTFLTRQIIRNLSEDVYQATRVSAYLLLPSACGDILDAGAKAKGDRNAYAALKEIDYFMGLQDRKEKYCQMYDTFNVEIAENIFDFCTLVEGIADGGGFFGNPAETARRVTANSILNLVSTPEAKAGQEPFLVDAFLANRTAHMKAKVGEQSHRNWPRDANYSYNVIGYSSCVVPIDLMTVYVANKVFNRVWAQFEACMDATDEDAVYFLEECNLAPKDVRDAKDLATLRKRLQNGADQVFKEKGPYYMVNLIKKAIDQIRSDQFAGYAARKSRGPFVGGSWSIAEKRYQELENALYDMGGTLYETYKFVIKELQELLKHNAGLLTNAVEYSSVFGKSFCWSPIDLTAGDQASETISTYLDSLIPEEEAERKAQRFVDLLCSKKDEWTQIDAPEGKARGAFNAARLIREFVKDEFAACVNSTLEEFLVKLYSGDPSAQVPVQSADQDPEGHRVVKTAAARLVEGLSGKAGAMAQTRAAFQLSQCYNNVYITVPDGCKWLGGAIADYASSKHITQKNYVYHSSSQDEVILYKLYTGVPAWALSWVAQAELSYERANNETGLHIEYCRDGWEWNHFPNLFHQGLWSSENDWKMRGREADLLDQARKDLEKARGWDLVQSQMNDTEVRLYSVYTLTDRYLTIEDLMAQVVLDPSREYSRADVFGILEEKGRIKRVDLQYVNMVMSTTEKPVPDNIGWDLACGSLRRMMGVWKRLQRTLDVMEALNERLDAHNRQARLEARTRERRYAFLDSLTLEFLKYKDLRGRWYIDVGDEKPLGAALTRKIEQECKEYYAAQAFYALDEPAYQVLADALEKWRNDDSVPDGERARVKGRRQELKETFSCLRGLKRSDADHSYPMASSGFEEELGEEDSRKIRAFYDWVILNL